MTDWGNVAMKRVFTIFVALLFCFSIAAAHSGRTDSSGGHYNRSTGEYHYHHGKPAHQHPGGVCPYDNKGTSSAKADTPVKTEASASGTKSPSDSKAGWGLISIPLVAAAGFGVYKNKKRK